MQLTEKTKPEWVRSKEHAAPVKIWIYLCLFYFKAWKEPVDGLELTEAWVIWRTYTVSILLPCNAKLQLHHTCLHWPVFWLSWCDWGTKLKTDFYVLLFKKKKSTAYVFFFFGFFLKTNSRWNHFISSLTVTWLLSSNMVIISWKIPVGENWGFICWLPSGLFSISLCSISARF